MSTQALQREILNLKARIKAMQPEEVEKQAAAAVEKLEHLQTASDAEAAHQAADDVLCAFLRAIGHKEVADEFEAVERWYG